MNIEFQTDTKLVNLDVNNIYGVVIQELIDDSGNVFRVFVHTTKGKFYKTFPSKLKAESVGEGVAEQSSTVCDKNYLELPKEQSFATRLDDMCYDEEDDFPLIGATESIPLDDLLRHVTFTPADLAESTDDFSDFEGDDDV